jgi:hypothetical protein
MAEEQNEALHDWGNHGKKAFLSGGDDGFKKGEGVVGIYLAIMSDEDNLDTSSVPVGDLLEKMQDLKKEVEKMGIKIESNPEIFSGTMAT